MIKKTNQFPQFRAELALTLWIVKFLNITSPQSAGALECIDGISAEGQTPFQQVSWLYDIKQSVILNVPINGSNRTVSHLKCVQTNA